MCTLLCVCPPRVESLFCPVLSKSCNQIPLAFKVWFSRNSSSRCRTPRLGSLMWGSEPSLQWVDFCGISVLQFVSHQPSSYGIWIYCDCAPPTISLWLLLCLWMWGIFFGEFQCLPIDDCSAFSCDFSALARGSESSPSTPPSWTNLFFLDFKTVYLLIFFQRTIFWMYSLTFFFKLISAYIFITSLLPLAFGLFCLFFFKLSCVAYVISFSFLIDVSFYLV